MLEKDICLSTLFELHQRLLTSADILTRSGDFEKARREILKAGEVCDVLGYVQKLF